MGTNGSEEGSGGYAKVYLHIRLTCAHMTRTNARNGHLRAHAHVHTHTHTGRPAVRRTAITHKSRVRHHTFTMEYPSSSAMFPPGHAHLRAIEISRSTSSKPACPFVVNFLHARLSETRSSNLVASKAICGRGRALRAVAASPSRVIRRTSATKVV